MYSTNPKIGAHLHGNLSNRNRVRNMLTEQSRLHADLLDAIICQVKSRKVGPQEDLLVPSQLRTKGSKLVSEHLSKSVVS